MIKIIFTSNIFGKDHGKDVSTILTITNEKHIDLFGRWDP